MGVYKFFTNVGTISKFRAPEEGHEASSKLRTHKSHAQPYTVESQWWLVPRMCAPLLYCFNGSKGRGWKINIAYLARAGLHRCWVTDFCLVAPVIFSTIGTVVPCMFKWVSSHPPSKQARDKCSLRVFPELCVYGTCFLSPFWFQEFGGVT